MKVTGMAALKAYPGFLRIWAGNVVSRLGDSVDSIAFMWMVYKMTGSGILMGTIMALNFLPNLLVGPFAGVFVDRSNKKTVMLVSDLGRGAVVSLTCVLLFTGYIRLWHLYAFTVLNSTFESFAAPARATVIPRLVTDKADFLAANGLFRGASSLAEMVGLGLGGAIVAGWGAPAAMAVDALTFFFCASCVALTVIPGSPRESDPASRPGRFLDDFREGLRASFGSPVVRFCILLGVALNLFVSPFNVVAPIYADKTLNAGAGGFAALGTAITAAMMAGSFLVGQLSRTLTHKVLMNSGVFILGAGFLGLAASRSVLTAVVSGALRAINRDRGKYRFCHGHGDMPAGFAGPREFRHGKRHDGCDAGQFCRRRRHGGVRVSGHDVRNRRRSDRCFRRGTDALVATVFFREGGLREGGAGRNRVPGCLALGLNFE